LYNKRHYLNNNNYIVLFLTHFKTLVLYYEIVLQIISIIKMIAK